MKFTETDIAGACIINIEKYEDDRGFFARGFCEKEFKEQGISFRPVQANIGYSRQK
jgi:dTDP-4-dehydrorhamnose 3,5-epimerase